MRLLEQQCAWMVSDSENYYILQATATEDWATDKPHYLNYTSNHGNMTLSLVETK